MIDDHLKLLASVNACGLAYVRAWQASVLELVVDVISDPLLSETYTQSHVDELREAALTRTRRCETVLHVAARYCCARAPQTATPLPPPTTTTTAKDPPERGGGGGSLSIGLRSAPVPIPQWEQSVAAICSIPALRVAGLDHKGRLALTIVESREARCRGLNHATILPVHRRKALATCVRSLCCFFVACFFFFFRLVGVVGVVVVVVVVFSSVVACVCCVAGCVLVPSVRTTICVRLGLLVQRFVHGP